MSLLHCISRRRLPATLRGGLAVYLLVLCPLALCPLALAQVGGVLPRAVAPGAPSLPGTPAAAASAPRSALVVPATASDAAGAVRRGQLVTIDFSNAEIADVARAIAVITERNIVVDPRVRGSMNLSSDNPITAARAFELFAAALRSQNLVLAESAGIARVVPEADAKLQAVPVSVGEPRLAGNQVVTQIFRLNYESAANLVPILRPLIASNNSINANAASNSLVITDFTDNLQRIARIIAALDVSNATGIEIIKLEHALATDLAPVLQRLSDGTPVGLGAQAQAGAQADAPFRTTISAEPRSNALIVRAANPARLGAVRDLARQLDAPTSAKASGNIHVVHLKNADATRVAVTLRAALAGSSGAPAPTPGPAPGQGPGAAAAAAAVAAATAAAAQAASSATGGTIQADAATNSLVITASEAQYRQIRAVIDMLDTRRAQVFVESLIAEVNADKAAEFGVQWQNVLGSKGDKTIGLLGSNFSAGGNNILSLSAGNGAVPGKGFNFGLVRDIGGVYTLGLLANFLQTSGEGNVLSTPNLLTLDNEEAKIVVGQNVPFVTGLFTNTGAGAGASGTVNPFQTIERRDVGLTLRVKPQISENGTIKMQVFQEVSNIDPSSRGSPSGLITNKRSIESNILVEDGGIVVLGGLLQDEYSNSQEKVPGLGDIPLFGNLFRTEARTRKKTNLMVFLRPVVVRDAQATGNLALDRYDMMRGLQQGAQPAPSALVPVNEAPALPPRPALGAGPAPPPPLIPPSR